MPTVAKPSNGHVAIHLGTNAGYCLAGQPKVWVLPKHSGPGFVYAALYDALDDATRVSTPSRILVSAAPEDGEDAALTIGLTAIIQIFGHYKSVPVDLIGQDTLYKSVLQQEYATKRQIRVAITSFAKRRGMTSPDPDAAGALLLYEYGSMAKVIA